MFLFISSPEIIFILIVVLMLFGANKIPDIARELGKGMRQIKNATNQIKHEIRESGEKHLNASQLNDIQKEIDSIKNSITTTENTIKRQM